MVTPVSKLRDCLNWCLLQSGTHSLINVMYRGLHGLQSQKGCSSGRPLLHGPWPPLHPPGDVRSLKGLSARNGSALCSGARGGPGEARGPVPVTRPSGHGAGMEAEPPFHGC